MTDREAYQRGQRDAERGKPPLFRPVKDTYVSDIDDPMSDECERGSHAPAEQWGQDERAFYWIGYNLPNRANCPN